MNAQKMIRVIEDGIEVTEGWSWAMTYRLGDNTVEDDGTETPGKEVQIDSLENAERLECDEAIDYWTMVERVKQECIEHARSAIEAAECGDVDNVIAALQDASNAEEEIDNGAGDTTWYPILRKIRQA